MVYVTLNIERLLKMEHIRDSSIVSKRVDSDGTKWWDYNFHNMDLDNEYHLMELLGARRVNSSSEVGFTDITTLVALVRNGIVTNNGEALTLNMEAMKQKLTQP